MYEKKVITLEEAMKAMDAMLKEAAKIPDIPYAIAIVDNRGELVCCAKQDGCQKFRIDMAIRKARTSAQFRRSTRELEEGLKQSPEGLTISMFGSEYTTIPGGEAIYRPGGEEKGTGEYPREVYGAIGTSGRPAVEDEELAQLGVKIIQDILWPEK